MTPEPFDPQTASPEELSALHRFDVVIRAERDPGEPPKSYDQTVRDLTHFPPIVDVKMWTTWDDRHTDIIGFAVAIYPTAEANRHLAQVAVEVLPACRRQGVGSRLLRTVLEDGERDGRKLFVSGTQSTVPDGEEFARCVGAQELLQGHTNELLLAHVDRNLMRSWIEKAQERASEFELAFWTDRYPADRLADVAAMLQLFSTQPTGGIEVDYTMTPEEAGALDEANAARGITRWTAYVQPRGSHTIAGFTEIMVSKDHPHRVDQGLTAVFKEYQHRGLGRWLKAAMVEKILNEMPEARFIRTGNADENAPMLSINHEMGFKPAHTETMWQLPLEAAREFLDAAAASVVRS